MQPVILIHGIWRTGKTFRHLARHLEKQGWEPHALNLKPNNAAHGIESSAQQVAEYIEEHFPADQKINLIGFSMGGLVSRYYIQRLGGIHRVRKFLTISTPHNGSWMAYLMNHNRGVRQMRPNSDFLKDLDRDADMLKQLDFTSLWTPLDLMVLPGTSSITPYAVRHVSILAPIHPWMLIHPRCHSVISSFLKN